MSEFLPPLNNNTSIFNVSDFNYQDSYISYYTGDKRYSKLNGMNIFTQLCYFNGGITTSDLIVNNSITSNNIQCSSNIQTLTINNTPANYYEGLTQNIQQKFNSLTAGSPINGQSATISIGTTTTLSPGSNASVTNTGTNLDGVFNFGIPRGLQGIPGNQGNQGIPGNDGITPTFEINPMVDNIVSGSIPYVTITQNPINNYILKFGLVQGLNGTNGITPTFSINPMIDNLVSGSTPYVTITQSPINNYILKFGLVQGAKGEKGDKGDTPSQNDILSVINAALAGAGIVSIAILAGYVTILQGEVAGLITSVGTLQGQVSILDGEVATLISKTIGLSHSIGTGRSNFNNTLTITNLLFPITNAVELNATIPSNFYLGIITTGLTAGAIGCASVITTGDISVGGVFDVTGESNFAGAVTIEGIVNITGDTNIEGIANIVGDTNIEGIANIVGDANIEGNMEVTGNMEIVGGSITQSQVNDTQTGLPIPLSTNTLFNTNFVGNITQTNLLPNNPLHTPPTTTLLATSVKSLTIANGDIQQTLGTSSLYNLNVANNVNLNGFEINIGDNPENHIINIGSSQSILNMEGENIYIGVGTIANTINIGNAFTTLTLKSVTNQPINIDNAMNQMNEDINNILNEINGFF